MNELELLAKKMRFIEKFKEGIRLDIMYDDIVQYLGSFKSVWCLTKKYEIVGKPRFNLITPKTHCNKMILSKDYYLIGFTDRLNSTAVKLRFFYNDYEKEYLNETIIEEILPLSDSFERDLFIIENK